MGVAHPLSVYVGTFGTSTVDEEKIEKGLAQVVDLRPEAIIRCFNLRRFIYSAIACYAAFSRDDLDLPWEQTDIADKLRSLAGQLQAASSLPISCRTVNCEPHCASHNSRNGNQQAR